MKELLAQIERIEATNKGWSVGVPMSQPSQPVHPVVARALELRALELEVKDWTDDYHDSLDPDSLAEIRAVLHNHATDEFKHDEVLDHLANYWQHTEVSEESQRIIDMWISYPGNVLAKKTMLEAGVFFSVLPMMDRFSGRDFYTGKVREWIMMDEVRHVAISRMLVKHFGLKMDRGILSLIEQTIRHILSSESEEVQARWVKRSIEIAVKGKSDDFAEDSIRTTVGFFDQQKRSDITYPAH